jgi:peptidyl-prolyl isomerase H (cyclophilin H)
MASSEGAALVEPETCGWDVYDEKNSLELAVARGHRVVFLDVEIADRPAGRIKIELFTSVVPRSCENIRQLCTGEHHQSGLPVGYKGSSFHRVIRGFMIQGGDFVKVRGRQLFRLSTNHAVCGLQHDGTGSFSIYGSRFADEGPGLKLRHRSHGIVSMANSGANSNGCQFFITTEKADSLDGKHVVVGRVLDDASMMTVRMIENTPVGKRDAPSLSVKIVECGEL